MERKKRLSQYRVLATKQQLKQVFEQTEIKRGDRFRPPQKTGVKQHLYID